MEVTWPEHGAKPVSMPCRRHVYPSREPRELILDVKPVHLALAYPNITPQVRIASQSAHATFLGAPSKEYVGAKRIGVH